MDKGSCFNARRLVKKVDGGKSTIVCAETYTNPFAELVRAFYENVSWLTSLLTMSTLFARVKNRSCCPSCQQCTCATIAPSLMFAHSANRLAARKDRTGAVLCFHTITAFNKTGPLGNLKRVPPSTDAAAAAENGGNVVMSGQTSFGPSEVARRQLPARSAEPACVGHDGREHRRTGRELHEAHMHADRRGIWNQ